jgi:amino-acid N-acetyltransferase
VGFQAKIRVMTLPADNFVKTFRDSVPYLQAHRAATVVVGVDGAALADGVVAIAHDLLLLQALGMRLVVVVGARPQIEQALEQAGINTEIKSGVRITSAEAQQVVNQAVGQVRVELEAALSRGLPESPYQHQQVPVVSGNYVIAQPIGVRDGVDYQHSGELRRLETAALSQQLDMGAIVLLPCLGYSPSGEVFNLAAEELAIAAAKALKADKLAWLGPVADANDWPQVLTPAMAKASDDIALQRLADASETVARVHRLDSAVDGALLKEFYTRDGAGLLITDGGYDSERAATVEDIGGVLTLIEPLEQQGVLVPRSREQLELEIEQFQLLERDGLVVGCAALFPLGEANAGELACLAVHPDYRQQQLAKVLLRRIEAEARKQALGQLFVLTTHTAHWFKEQGFDAASIEDLPVARQQLYNNQRNSQVLVKSL